MKNRLAFSVAFSVIFSLCVFAQEQNLNRWTTMPEQGGLVVIGVSGRMSRLEASIENARADAARRVAMHSGIQAEIEHTLGEGAGFFDHFRGSAINIDFDRQAAKYRDALIFDPDRDVFIRDNAVIVRFTFPGVSPGAINFDSGQNPDGSPRWTRQTPREIAGFYAGVGFAGRRQRLADTMERSAEAAVVSIVSGIASSITASAGEQSSAHNRVSFIQQRSAGRLSQFTILETWIDPVSGAVWTLAIARRAE